MLTRPSMSETPRKLGRYELIRRIAVGGMGEIYLARTSGTAGFEKTVIIKTILPHLAEEEEFVEKFLDEGRIVVNLTHGNIVPVFDMDEADGEYFIAMEYVPGRDLRAVLARLRERGETMPPDLAAYVISEVCEGLGYAHDKTDDEGTELGIVHRDVSPSNVLISTEGEVKIIDFGVARAADRRAKTVSGRIQGKCCYMSPEQARGESLDYRSDIFSAGLVFYELLTCQRPFDGGSDLKSLELVRACEFDPPSHLEGDVPPELDLVIERAMAEEPDERYDAITEMKVDLMEYLVSRGRAVTSGEVADFLSDLFPEGLEREEFQDAREEADEPSGPMELDDALEYQLDQLGGQQVDPLDETLPEEVDSPSAGTAGRTETITPESGLRERSESGDDRSGSGAATAPERPGAEEEASAGGEPSSRRAAPGDSRGETAAAAGGRRWIGVGLAVAGVVGLFALGWWAVGGEKMGTLHVKTEPAGAVVRVDGSRIPGGTTPREVDLRPGTHTIELTREGRESEQFRIVIGEGEDETLSTALDPKPKPAESEEAPRRVAVRTDPPGATVWANREELGSAPLEVEVRPEAPTFLEVDREGCDRARRPVYYDGSGDTVRVTLNCEGSTAAAGGAGEPPEEGSGPAARSGSTTSSAGGSARTERVELEFRSNPAGASVRIDGESVGETPLSRTVRRGVRLEVTFEKSGYQSVEKEVDVDELEDGRVRAELGEPETGCLNFFAVHPQYNELAIDGEWLEGRRQKLQNYELPAGTHEIRVRNPDAGKDETFTFRVDAGDECTSLTVWDPDEG